MSQDTTNVVEKIPRLKPGVSSSYGNGWRQLWKYFLELFLIIIISGLISLPTAVSEIGDNLIVPVLGMFAVVYGILIDLPPFGHVD